MSIENLIKSCESAYCAVVSLSVIILSFPAFPVSALVSGYPAVITKITDGDTVWVRTDGRRIKLRLPGINTPEKYYSKKMLKDVRMCGTSYNQMKQFQLLVQNKLGNNVEVDFGSPRVLLVAQTFSKYDQYAINRMAENIELWGYSRYEDNIFELKLIASSQAKKSTSTAKQITKVNYEEYSVEDHLKNTISVEITALLSTSISKTGSGVFDK